MALLKLSPLPQVSWSKLHMPSEMRLIAEASDFGRNMFKVERLYDDACDMGICIHFSQHDVDVTFYLSETDLAHKGTEDEEVIGWHFKPIAEHARKFPFCANFVIVILND